MKLPSIGIRYRNWQVSPGAGLYFYTTEKNKLHELSHQRQCWILATVLFFILLNLGFSFWSLPAAILLSYPIFSLPYAALHYLNTKRGWKWPAWYLLFIEARGEAWDVKWAKEEGGDPRTPYDIGFGYLRTRKINSTFKQVAWAADRCVRIYNQIKAR